jgi:hypothetical protein
MTTIIYSIGSRLFSNPLVTLLLSFSIIMFWGLRHLINAVGL